MRASGPGGLLPGVASGAGDLTGPGSPPIVRGMHVTVCARLDGICQHGQVLTPGRYVDAAANLRELG